MIDPGDLVQIGLDPVNPLNVRQRVILFPAVVQRHKNPCWRSENLHMIHAAGFADPRDRILHTVDLRPVFHHDLTGIDRQDQDFFLKYINHQFSSISYKPCILCIFYRHYNADS